MKKTYFLIIALAICNVMAIRANDPQNPQGDGTWIVTMPYGNRQVQITVYEAYTITCDLQGGTWELPDTTITYYEDTPDFTLSTPTRDGYSFVGWNEPDSTQIQDIVTIVQGTTGDKTYIANWNPILPSASITTDPIGADSLVYTGGAQALLNNDGVAVGGTLNYSLDNSTWSEAIPSAIPAGNYTVYYKVVGDASHADYIPSPNEIAVSIAQADVSYTAPEAILGLEYTGAAQTLITAGSATGGEMQYKLGDGEWSTELPQATDADDYTVWYKVIGDANHNDVAETSIAVSIAAPSAMVLTANEDPQHADVYYSTFYHSAIAYELSAGVEAYVAELSTDALILTKIAEGGQVIPMDNAVILKSSSGSITLTPSDASPVSFDATNNLHGVDVPTAAPANCYVLSGHSTDYSVTGVGFYQYTGTLKAHKAYVVIGGGSAGAPKKLRFVFEQEQTTTDVENSQFTIHNSQCTKVIRNGQLIIIRGDKEYNAQGKVVK